MLWRWVHSGYFGSMSPHTCPIKLKVSAIISIRTISTDNSFCFWWYLENTICHTCGSAFVVFVERTHTRKHPGARARTRTRTHAPCHYGLSPLPLPPKTLPSLYQLSVADYKPIGIIIWRRLALCRPRLDLQSAGYRTCDIWCIYGYISQFTVGHIGLDRIPQGNW